MNITELLIKRNDIFIPPSILSIEGFSCDKVKTLLNLLCSSSKGYLEVGSWKGSTLIAAAYGNTTPVWACDNFSEFEGSEEIFFNNLRTHIPDRPINFMNGDFRSIPNNPEFSPTGVDCYFYDGAHLEVDQYDALVCLEHLLEDQFTYIVDDWNHPPVQVGTRKAIKDLGFKIIEDIELPARWNGDIENWWNGLYIAKIRKY